MERQSTKSNDQGSSRSEASSNDHPERVAGGVRLGQALEKSRIRLGYSLEAAATALGISERLLGQIEAGLRTPTEGLLVLICERFGLDRDRLGTRAYLPRLAPHLNEDETILWLGWLPIQLPPGYGTAYLISAIGSTIRTMRSLRPSQPVYLRGADIPLLVGLLDVEDPDLPRLMIQHLGLTLTESIKEVQRMQAVLNREDPWAPPPLVLTTEEPQTKQTPHGSSTGPGKPQAVKPSATLHV